MEMLFLSYFQIVHFIKLRMKNCNAVQYDALYKILCGKVHISYICGIAIKIHLQQTKIKVFHISYFFWKIFIAQ